MDVVPFEMSKIIPVSGRTDSENILGEMPPSFTFPTIDRCSLQRLTLNIGENILLFFKFRNRISLKLYESMKHI